MKRFALVFILLFSQAHASEGKDRCLANEWAHQDSRTQGGEWIWFPGKGASSTLADAYFKAEGLALTRLVQECGFPHKEVKIHERCDFEEGLEFKAFVRLSIVDSKCNEAKYAGEKHKQKILNSELNNIFMRYQEKIGHVEHQLKSSKTIDCNTAPIKKCLDQGRVEFSLENYKVALEYFDEVCRQDDTTGCFNAGLSSWMMKDYTKGAGYFTLPCKNDDAQACLFKGKIYRAQGKSPTDVAPLMEKACSLKNAEGCFFYAQTLEEQRKLDDAGSFYEKACSLKNAEACHQGSRFFYDLDKKVQSEKLAKIGCDNKQQKSCYNYAYIVQKKNPVQATQNYDKACSLGLALGCERAGDSLEKSPELASNHYLKGCKIGSKENCQKLAFIYLAKKDQTHFKKFTQEACLLGEQKACFNLGIIERKAGNTAQAKSYFELACKNGQKEACDAESVQADVKIPSTGTGVNKDSCSSNADCSTTYTCATVRGEYPGVCTKSGFGF